MLERSLIEEIATELVQAGQDRSVVPLLTARYPGMQVEDSYAIQQLWSEQRIAAGARQVGRKIGLTSKVMQEATGITEPDYGVIHDDAVFDSGTVFEFSHFSNVRIEVELSFVLRHALRGPGVTLTDVYDATAYVVPSLEVLNSHIEMEGRTIIDTISDNAALGAVVIGGRPVSLKQLNLPRVGALVYRNETIEDSGLAGAVLGNPALGVAWLANKLSAHGQGLEAGEVILSGSFTKPLWANRGDVVHADFGELGTVSCKFV